MDLNGKNTKRILLIVAISILLFVCVQKFEIVIAAASWAAKLLSPLVAGLCIAFIFNVLLKFLEERCFASAKISGKKWWEKNHRLICLMLTYLLLAGAMCVLFFLVGPQLKKSCEKLIENMPGYLASLETWLTAWMAKRELPTSLISGLSADWDKILEKALNLVQDFGLNVLDSTVNVASGIVNGILNLVLGLVFSVYLLAKKEAFCLNCKRALFAFLPRDKAEYLISVGKLSNKTFARFVSGQLTEAMIIGVLCFIGMGVFRMPYASLISTLVGVTALVPIFGAFIGTAIGAFVLLMVNPLTAVWFVVFIIVLQQIESNIIYPKVVGTSVGLPGIWVLFAVMIGGDLFGVMGMLVGIPLASVAYALFRDTVGKRLRQRKITKAEVLNAGKNDFDA